MCENNDYECLGVHMNHITFNEAMISRIKDTKKQLRYVEKLCNNLVKYKLLRLVLNIDGYVCYIQNAPAFRPFDPDTGKFI